MSRIQYLFLLILTLLSSAGTFASAGTTSPSLRPGMPDEVRSLIEVSLTSAQYNDLARQWQEYSQQHPGSAFAHIMVYKALFYEGVNDVEKLQDHITRALEIDPLSPEALNAAMHTALRHGKPLGSRQQCYEYGLKATEVAPEWATPHAMLYVLSILLDYPEKASAHLIAMVEKGFYSSAMLDYGYNMLVSAEPGGIIFTNGDIDTYPCLSLQAYRGIRTDVTIANISLLTLPAMAKNIFTTAPGDQEAVLTIDELSTVGQDFYNDRAGYGYMLGNALLQSLCSQVSSGQLQRPLYLAVSLQTDTVHTCGASLALEGLLQRVLPGEKNYSPIPVTNMNRTFELFNSDYRLDSATGFSQDWNREPAFRQLMKNYSNILLRLGFEAGTSNNFAIMEFAFKESMTIATFHKDSDTTDLILRYWKELAPDSENLKPWLK